MEKSYTLLLVDDQANNLRVIVQYLEMAQSNYKILQALGGQMAYQIAKKHVPDLIILDWDMPGINGIETLGLLKGDEITREISVIMTTGVMTSPEHLRVALHAGAIDYIRKPIEQIELLARVHSSIKLSESLKKIKRQSIEIEQINFEKQKKLKEEIEYKAREMVSNALKIAQNNKVIYDTIRSLSKLKSQLTTHRKELQIIINKLKLNQKSDTWREFQLRFTEVHADFYTNLTIKFPELTPNEKKLCAFLLLNMTTKNISDITYQSTKSIDVARSRLRKKLNLSRDKNLHIFLASLA